MSKSVIIIATYNRPDHCLNLLKDIAKIPDVRVKVYNDGSTESYGDVEEYLLGMDSYYIKVPHMGKQGFYKLHQMMYREMIGERYDYFIQLLDDMRLVDDFHNKAIKQFNDSGADLLNIINMDVLVGVMQKAGVKMRTVNGVGFWDFHWLDLCFITTQKYLESLNYTCPDIPAAWFKRKKHTSSGVSTALTRAYKGKISVVDKSLLIHTGVVSQMNTYKVPYKSRL